MDTALTPAPTPARVVVADDEDDLLELVELKLRRAGVDVVGVSSGAEALEAYRAARPAVLVLDVMMPGLSGLDVLREIRASDPELPVILLTAKAHDVDRHEGLDAGCTEYITKPFSPADLLSRVQSYLAAA